MRTAPNSRATSRLVSVDVLRGVVMFLMLLVNDIGALPAVPTWLKHFKPDLGNGMTFVDVVFPAFLFVVGLSIPLAMDARRARGGAGWRALLHLLVRTGGLVLLGVFMVNFRGWGWWPILALLASIAAFITVRDWPNWLGRTFRACGLVALAALAAVYPSVHPGETFRTQWWGILGLIGWAYFGAGLIYLAATPRMWHVRPTSAVLPGPTSRVTLVTGAALCTALFFAAAQPKFGSLFAGRTLAGLPFVPTDWFDLGSMFGTHVAISLLGALLGTGLLPDAPEQTHPARVRLALLIALGAGLAALLTYPSFGVNKNIATPAWAFASVSLTSLLFAGIYLLTDAKPLLPAPAQWLLTGVGGGALAAYLLQPLFTRALVMTGISYDAAFTTPALGVLRGLTVAGAISLVTALAYHRGIRLRL